MASSNHLAFLVPSANKTPSIGFVRWSRAETTCRPGVPPPSPFQTLFVIGNDSSYVILLKFSEVAYIKQIEFIATFYVPPEG